MNLPARNTDPGASNHRRQSSGDRGFTGSSGKHRHDHGRKARAPRGVDPAIHQPPLTIAGGRLSVAINASVEMAGTGAFTMTAGGRAAFRWRPASRCSTNGGNISLTAGSGGISPAANSVLDSGAGTTRSTGRGGGHRDALEAPTTASAIAVTNATTLSLGGQYRQRRQSRWTIREREPDGAITGAGVNLSSRGAGTLTSGQGQPAFGGTTTVSAGTLNSRRPRTTRWRTRW